MRPSTTMLLGLSLLGDLSCGELYRPPPAEFEELCGEAGPVRLASFEPGQFFNLEVERFGERVVASVYRVAEDGQGQAQLWSMGPCGEQADFLLEGFQQQLGLRTFAPWPELAFVCTEAGELLAVDPTGKRPPFAAFRSRGCRVLETPAGLAYVAGEGEFGPLVLQPWPDDPLADAAEEIVLAETVLGGSAEPLFLLFGLTWEQAERRWQPLLRGSATTIFAVSEAGELLAFPLAEPTSEPEILAEQILAFQVDDEGRRVLWTAPAPDGEADEEPSIHFLDRELGEAQQIGLGDVGRGYEAFALEAFGLLTPRCLIDADEQCIRGWLTLDGFEAVELRERLPDLEVFDTAMVLDDERVLFARFAFEDQAGFTPPVQLADFAAGEVLNLIELEAPRNVSFGARGLHGQLLLSVDDALLRVSLDGQVQAIAPDRPNTAVVASDWRVFGERYGELVFIDPDSHEERLIDDLADGWATHTLLEPEGGSVLVAYIVDEPGRRGLWLAQPAR